MLKLELQNVVRLGVKNFRIDTNSRLDLGMDLSLNFYLPSGILLFEETSLWFDMNLWGETLSKFKTGRSDSVAIHDLSRDIVFSLVRDGQRLRVIVQIKRPMPGHGRAFVEYEVTTDFDNLNLFARFMGAVLQEHKKLL